MTYATTQDFIDGFSQQEMLQLTNLWDASAVTINTDNLLRNQKRAFSLINSYIASDAGNAQYLPFVAPFPELLVSLEIDLTWYYLHKSQETEAARSRFEDAIRVLERIASGKHKLGLDGATPPEVLTGSNLPQVVRANRVFTQESLRDFNIGYNNCDRY